MTATTIKISEETKNALQALQTEHGFASMEELQRHLTALAKTTETAKNVTALAPAIKCVDELCDRLRGMLNSAGDSFLTETEKYKEVLNTEKSRTDNIILSLQNKIAKLEEQIKNDDITALKAEISELSAKLTASQNEISRLNTKLTENTQEYAHNLEKFIFSQNKKQNKTPAN